MRRQWTAVYLSAILLAGCLGPAAQISQGQDRNVPTEWLVSLPVTSETHGMRCPVLALIVHYPWHVPDPWPLSQELVIFDLTQIATLNYALHNVSWSYGEIEWVWPLHGVCAAITN